MMDSMERINLMLIEDGDRFHYTWIKDINRLLYNQSKHREHKYFCERCLCGYSKEEFLIKHKEDCQGIGKTAVRIEMPEEVKY